MPLFAHIMFQETIREILDLFDPKNKAEFDEKELEALEDKDGPLFK